MSSKLLEENQPIAEINIIPFVDIILVILVIFMVTIPVIIQKGFSINLPNASSAKTINHSKINISIRSNGDILLNKKLFNLEQIKKQITNNDKKPEDIYIVISADKNVLHGKLISVINTLTSLGISHVTITTQQTQ